MNFYTIGGDTFEWHGATLRKLAHGTIRTDEKGRVWYFNGETRRWRIQKTKEGAKAKSRATSLDILQASKGDVRTVAGQPHIHDGEAWVPMKEGESVQVGSDKHVFQNGRLMSESANKKNAEKKKAGGRKKVKQSTAEKPVALTSDHVMEGMNNAEELAIQTGVPVSDESVLQAALDIATGKAKPVARRTVAVERDLETASMIQDHGKLRRQAKEAGIEGAETRPIDEVSVLFRSRKQPGFDSSRYKFFDSAAEISRLTGRTGNSTVDDQKSAEMIARITKMRGLRDS